MVEPALVRQQFWGWFAIAVATAGLVGLRYLKRAYLASALYGSAEDC